MKYCKETTLAHPLSIEHKDNVEQINTILSAEGFKTVSFCDKKALNLDKVEINCCKREKRNLRPTMDMVIGIKKDEKNSQMLLIELKFNVNNSINLSKTELLGKINNSICLLTQEIPIHQIKIIIFKKEIIRQAKNYLARQFMGTKLKDQIVVQSAQEFKEIYFSSTTPNLPTASHSTPPQ